MPSVPRIIVIDPTHDVIRIMHGALTLLNRQYVLIEVPTAEDALAEVQRTKVDLVVTAYNIPGSMDGLALATSISHESLGTPTIVMAEEDAPPVDEQIVNEAPFQYFMRPVAEPFLRGLRFALDGEAAVAGESQESAPAVNIGPVPPIKVNDLRNIVMSLMRDVGAMGAILADRTGRVLVDEGATGYIDREKLAVILGPSFANAVEIGPLVGGNAWTMHYYDGERVDVFGLALGVHYFMALIFEGSNRGAFGAVTRFGRRAADQMIEMIGEAAYAVRRPEARPAPREKEKTPVVAEAAPAPLPARKASTPRPEKVEPAPAPPPSAAAALPDFDPDALFDQSIDEGLAASMFDPDKIGDLAAMMSAEEDERVGYDEAINMGILNE
jgi:CheY-like chemotaxis protein